MRAVSIRSILAVVTIVFAAVGCFRGHQATIYNVSDMQIYMPDETTLIMDDVHRIIIRGIRPLGWTVESESLGRIIAEKEMGGHMARVAIDYNTKEYSITHVNNGLSFKYEDLGNREIIHKKYNIWIKKLEHSIQSAFRTNIPRTTASPAEVSLESARRVEEYCDGKQHGKSTGWYENGQKKFEGELKNGKQHRKWSWWYENGQKKGEIEFRDGKIHGKETWWWKTGKKRVEREFRDGKQNGKGTKWYENGQKEQEGEFRDGIPYGKATLWYKNGQKESEMEWRDGELISEKCWDKDGNPIPCK